MSFDNVGLFPVTADVSAEDHLVLGGCSSVDLASEFGTPLYVYAEETLRGMCREFTREFSSRYNNTKVVYASKAYINPALARLMAEEGLGLDVVSGGELAVAQSVDFPPEDIYFHGNNKTPDELQMALEYGVDDRSMLLERASRNTHENAVLTGQLLSARGIERIILIAGSS